MCVVRLLILSTYYWSARDRRPFEAAVVCQVFVKLARVRFDRVALAHFIADDVIIIRKFPVVPGLPFRSPDPTHCTWWKTPRFEKYWGKNNVRIRLHFLRIRILARPAISWPRTSIHLSKSATFGSFNNLSTRKTRSTETFYESLLKKPEQYALDRSSKAWRDASTVFVTNGTITIHSLIRPSWTSIVVISLFFHKFVIKV